MTRYSVRHRTFYRYGQKMSSGQSIGHLRPRDTPNQDVVSASIAVEPAPEDRTSWIDSFGNPVDSFTITARHETLEVVSMCSVDVRVPIVPALDEPWENVMAAMSTGLSDDEISAQQFALPSPFVPYMFELHALAKETFTKSRPFGDALRALTHLIFSTYSFDPHFSDVSTPLEDVVAHRRGVCQDFAHLMVGAMRAIGFAARYVSGYIETDPPLGETKLIGSDASHAWCSVYVPGHGWIDADPTNDQLPPRRHITVAWGRDYGDVPPLRGVVLGPASTQAMTVEVDVTRTTP